MRTIHQMNIFHRSILNLNNHEDETYTDIIKLMQIDKARLIVLLLSHTTREELEYVKMLDPKLVYFLVDHYTNWNKDETNN